MFLRAVKGLGFCLPFQPTDEPDSFMDAGRRHRPPQSETEDYYLPQLQLPEYQHFPLLLAQFPICSR